MICFHSRECRKHLINLTVQYLWINYWRTFIPMGINQMVDCFAYKRENSLLSRRLVSLFAYSMGLTELRYVSVYIMHGRLHVIALNVRISNSFFRYTSRETARSRSSILKNKYLVVLTCCCNGLTGTCLKWI